MLYAKPVGILIYTRSNNSNRLVQFMKHSQITQTPYRVDAVLVCICIGGGMAA